MAKRKSAKTKKRTRARALKRWRNPLLVGGLLLGLAIGGASFQFPKSEPPTPVRAQIKTVSAVKKIHKAKKVIAAKKKKKALKVAGK